MKPANTLPQQRLDTLIRDLYSKPQPRGAVKTFADKYGMPRHQVRSRALAIGAVQQTRKEPPWSDAEIELLESHYWKNPDNIRQIMSRRGYKRTATAISVKRKRLHLFVADCDDVFTATGLSNIMGIDAKTVTRWIEKGWLKAKKKGTERTERQGGDMWQISRKDLKRFIKENVAVVEIHKADKFWLVDLLAN